ncbi:MAG: lipocalin family protein [Prolixibacteraceae bacterium]|nr:lipocalin family protein [Prolixibacteraceae bacterium]
MVNILSLKQTIILCLIMILSAGGCKSKHPENMDLSTIKELDLERYMGKWYEIARFDHSFERNLTGVSATYNLRPDGRITVINQGYKDSPEGKHKVAEGKAKQPDPSEPGKLKVAFFLFFYADYFILELEENYKWALIGSSSDKYLWILSRTPRLEEDVLNDILNRAKRRGYDTGKLIWVKQDT